MARRAMNLCAGLVVSKTVKAVRLRNSREVPPLASDMTGMRVRWVEGERAQAPSLPWALEVKAISAEEPSRLVKVLTGAILGCGGWVLCRGANDSGMVSLLFEFERQACLDIYSVLIAAGLELSQYGHIRFTELCQCTRSRQQECGREIATVDLEIQTVHLQVTGGADRPEAA